MTASISSPGVVFILYLIIIRHSYNIQLKAKLFKQKTRNFACIEKKPQGFLKLVQRKTQIWNDRIYSQVFYPKYHEPTSKTKRNKESVWSCELFDGRRRCWEVPISFIQRPCHFVVTATTRDVSTAATQAVKLKAFEFR